MVARRLVASVSLLALAMAVLAANAGSCSAQAQSVPNLGGTWELIEFDSTKQRVIGDKFPKLILVISQEGSQIRIVEKRTKQGTETVQEYSYYLDGRGETNIGRLELWPREVPKLESVSGWQKDKLITKYNELVSLGTERSRGGLRDYSATNSVSRRNDEWRLKPDGKTLVLTSSVVLMDSVANTGKAPTTSFPNETHHDGVASFGVFGKTKFVFRKI